MDDGLWGRVLERAGPGGASGFVRGALLVALDGPAASPGVASASAPSNFDRLQGASSAASTWAPDPRQEKLNKAKGK